MNALLVMDIQNAVIKRQVRIIVSQCWLIVVLAGIRHCMMYWLKKYSPSRRK